jgi:hypothetical protein
MFIQNTALVTQGMYDNPPSIIRWNLEESIDAYETLELSGGVK